MIGLLHLPLLVVRPSKTGPMHRGQEAVFIHHDQTLVHQRKKRYGARVKTGCYTCRVRRIKCDEAKPKCRRCTSSGRQCEGYASSPPTWFHTRKAPSSIPWNTLEHEMFDLLCTFVRKGKNTRSAPWLERVLPLSHDHPTLWFGVTAVASALRSHLEPSDDNRRNTLSLYHRATSEIRKFDPRNLKDIEKSVILACALLLTTVCRLAGDPKAGLLHQRFASNVVKEWTPSDSVPLLLNWRNGAFFLDEPDQHQHQHQGNGSPPHIPSRDFTNLVDVYLELKGIWEGIIDARTDTTLDLVTIRSFFLRALTSWDERLETFMATTNKKEDLKAHYRAIRARRLLIGIFLKSDPDGECDPSTYAQDFDDIEKLADLNRNIIVKEGVTHKDSPMVYFATAFYTSVIDLADKRRDPAERAKILRQYALNGVAIAEWNDDVQTPRRMVGSRAVY